MLSVEIKKEDILSLELAMKKLDAKVLLEGEWSPFLDRVQVVAGTYPPDFPDNTYKRTGHLGKSWQKEVVNPLEAQIGNAALYAGWVHGHHIGEPGLDLHVGHGWKNLFDEGSRLLDILAEKIGRKAIGIWTGTWNE